MARMTASTLPETTTRRSLELTKVSPAICIDAPAACHNILIIDCNSSGGYSFYRKTRERTLTTVGEWKIIK